MYAITMAEVVMLVSVFIYLVRPIQVYVLLYSYTDKFVKYPVRHR